MHSRLRLVALLGLGTAAAGFFAAAQTAGPKTAPPPGSPAGTTTLDGRYLPNPPAPFGGTINLNAAQSKPYWPPRVVPPKGAPNVLLIMTDDVGFGAPSTFGGVIPTPNLDRVAKMGLRYTNFHSTALCSPTRAALITGRNHHQVGFGVISEFSTGYPGYNSIITKDKATVGTILRDNGYGTSWFGKNHNVPDFLHSQAGPFDQWAGGLGFEYFYGFVGGDTSQWAPGNLYRNTTQIYPQTGNPNFNLTTAMADDAVDWIHTTHAVAPDKPFFCYYVPGGTHAPHHPTKEWVKKIQDMKLFDGGWNKLRETIFANQKKLGVIPPNAELTPWPKDVLKEWDQLSADEKKLFVRQVEVYAAYLAYTDYEIGRVIRAVEETGQLDNTLIVYISGDNGSSAEGSPNGTPNEIAQFNGIEYPVGRQLAEFYDAWGTEKTYNHMAVGWTWAFDTPFKWTKQMASYFGGTRQGMCVAWPNRIKDAGGVRHQFHHVIDVVPTILEAAGVPAPVMVNGIGQTPMDGVSMTYTWDKANAAAPSARKTQYFEMLGNRAVYHDGWVACTVPLGTPWNLTGKLPDDVVNGYQWELYHVAEDWTQNKNVAKENPAKLRELQELFLVEAARNQVFPLDNALTTRGPIPRPSAAAGRDTFTYLRPITGIPQGAAANFIGRNFTVTADVDVPAGGAEGVLNTSGGRFGGYGLYLLKGKPVFTYNLVDFARFRWQAKEALPPGKHTVAFDFTYDGPGMAKGGTGVLKVDGRPVDSRKIPATMAVVNQWDESFDVGSDTGSPVDDRDYRVPFPFTGKLNRLTVKIGPSQILPAQKQAIEKKLGAKD